MKKLPLHTQIFIGLAAGILWSCVATVAGWSAFTIDWIKPFGIIFINLLKVIAVPLVIITIIVGVSSLADISRLAKIGGRTLGWFTGLTLISSTLGLVVCLVFSPGKSLPPDSRDELRAKYASSIEKTAEVAREVKDSGPLQIVQDIVPENFFQAISNNRNMLQIIFFSILFGIGMVVTPRDKTSAVRQFFDGANDILINIVHLIMRFAPYGVGALIAGLIADLAGNDPVAALELFRVLGYYALVFTLAIGILMGLIYPVVVYRYTRFSYFDFLKKLAPAQLLAFSTSSSAATLPVTIDCVEKNLKIKNEIAGFVLPLGITINMHGTAVHQAVCAVFIAHAFGHDLTLTQYAIIVVTASLGAMGAPAVPGAGLIMLLMVLAAIGVEEEGLALILAVDRPLDMLRTIPNVVGDALVAAVIDHRENVSPPVNS